MHRMVLASWQSVGVFANQLWAGCAQYVGALCVSFGQFRPLHHSQFTHRDAMGINPRFLHRLYHFFTHLFPTLFYSNSPLLSYWFSTPSTAPTMTTTTYIIK